MATRPVFVPKEVGPRLVENIPVNFQWHSGMAPSQKKKNIVSLHQAASKLGISNILEISSKSDDRVGQRLSAFSLKITLGKESLPLESVYQASKVFHHGGPFRDILGMSPRDAKRDIRLKSSGNLIAFELEGKRFPLIPPTAFYDWIYIRSLFEHRIWIRENVRFDAFTDIEFNPQKSLNCQARAFAEYVSLDERGLLDKAVSEFEFFAHLLPAV
jgi:hypothetical protein